MIPNPVVWLLPEFQDLASSLTTTLSLPNLVPHGAFVTPTSDGFLLFLPSSAPLPMQTSDLPCMRMPSCAWQLEIVSGTCLHTSLM